MAENLEQSVSSKEMENEIENVAEKLKDPEKPQVIIGIGMMCGLAFA
jgi:hypothetical protein